MDRDVRVLRAALIALALTFTILPLLTALPLFDPDEGLHAAIAQEMATRGDYVTPTSPFVRIDSPRHTPPATVIDQDGRPSATRHKASTATFINGARPTS